MIGIITYVSVLERTKEIGILRSLGARKKDISRVFNAETIIIGFTAGVIGVAIAFGLTFPLNALIRNLVDGIENLAQLSILAMVSLIAISVFLTFMAGLIPSQIAAKKHPVDALRIE
jgi:putative ABC transport system permease protein